MQKIIGKEKSLSDLLSNKKYTIHYYQREYRWGKKQIEELIDDLTGEFYEFYESGNSRDMVEQYGHYFLGSIVFSSGENQAAIIDGQQRLTSLTLLLIYLNNLQRGKSEKVAIDHLIFSDRHGIRSFNINVDEREACLNALYTDKASDFTVTNAPESVKTIFERYQDITEIFPDDLRDKALPFFIDWLIYNVDLVEISAYTEQDAHKIFVSMNDRGLSLTPTEMLKGFLLSEIKSDKSRVDANEIWKKQILELTEIDTKEDDDFFKNWLRAQYANSIRETKKGAVNEDFDIIGTTFHKWVRENAKKIGLVESTDYERFVMSFLPKYAAIYKLLKKYSLEFNTDYECVFYNAERNFTLQYQVILSAIDPADTDEIVRQKIQIVSRYIDQYNARRSFNFKTLGYNAVKNAMFVVSKKIRRKTAEELRNILIKELEEMDFDLEGIDEFYLNQFTIKNVRHVLARITYYLEKGSGRDTEFTNYVDREVENPYDIEHIWADHYERFTNQFETEKEFKDARNRFGDLLILPQDKNRSFNDATYSEKLPMYFGENLLAKSLNEKCYQNNPHFLRFIENEKLDFKAIDDFTKESIQSRQQLYKSICLKIWDTKLLEK
ncbi:MAG: DUF262 domain-containing protein [Candidatus Taylorbacteria bacterium]